MKKLYHTKEQLLEAGRRYKLNEILRLKEKSTPEEWEEYCKQRRFKQQKYYSQRRRDTAEGYADRLVERARAMTKDSDLTRGYILELIQKGCSITGKPFVYVNPFNSKHNPYAPSIDQVVPKGGYYKSNIQIMFSCINRLKNDLQPADFNTVWRALTNKKD